ncbi:hydrogenase maturation protease [Thioflavicoccus mobilis 8321]|uniref:Hydrogenase maturation protease n=1 Tax=Thioflavicoccus mobilis 8321 TaxID=765912 RepID=L0GZB0_9GAMM|nr:HyaD/HybD family hydrogenase maturation endopeptidase [Thioflavicoccus mobilis]AGA91172.1 hydrogenase maturation protease [Thioflavicoccus mobilis 8321]
MSGHSEQGGEVLVIGWGNILLSDEGVGVHALRRLGQDYRFEPCIRLEDGGTSGPDLLHLFAEHQRILMLDAVALDESPGTVRVIRGPDIQRVLTQKLSVHHLGVSDVLALAELMDYRPEEIVLVGVVPENLELGLELSPRLAECLPRLIEAALAVLRGWGVRIEVLDETDRPAEPMPTG